MAFPRAVQLGEEIMMRRWMSLAVAVGCLGWTANLPAQNFMPTPLGAARMPDPTPTAPSTVGGPPAAPTPALIQGPMTAAQAPPGPPSGLSLPENHTGAFQAENFPPDTGLYFHIGALAFQRDHLGSGGV